MPERGASSAALIATLCAVAAGVGLLHGAVGGREQRPRPAPTSPARALTPPPPPPPPAPAHDPRYDQKHGHGESVCAAYGWEPLKGKKRRLYVGALVAGANVDVVRVFIEEVSPVAKVVALADCDRAFDGKQVLDEGVADALSPGGALHRFGSQVSVVRHRWRPQFAEVRIRGKVKKVPNYRHPWSQNYGREAEQRRALSQELVSRGLRGDDVVVIADHDEIPSRQWLRALQSCAVDAVLPQRPSHGDAPPPCGGTVLGRTVFLEGFFDCPFFPVPAHSRFYGGHWHHPDASLGSCLLPSGGAPGPLRLPWDAEDVRTGMGSGLCSDRLPESERKPLNCYNMAQKHGARKQRTDVLSGWHLHNFESPSAVVRKYRSYGHPHRRATDIRSINDTHLQWRLECERRRGSPSGTLSRSQLPEAVRRRPAAYRQYMLAPERFGVRGRRDK